VSLGVFHRTAVDVTFRESLTWSAIWVALALLFNYGFYRYAVTQAGPEVGARLGLEFLAGYVVEKSLAVDNVFVFVMVFGYFGSPSVYQHRVLFYGILGALLFPRRVHRPGFGADAVSLGRRPVRGLAARHRCEDALGTRAAMRPDQNPLIRLVRRLMPITPELHGQRFFVLLNGRRHATPLFVALLLRSAPARGPARRQRRVTSMRSRLCAVQA